VLRLHRQVHAVVQFNSNLTELTSHSLRVRSSLDRKLAAPGHAAIVREPEKGKCFRTWQLLSLSITSGKAPELDQPCLVSWSVRPNLPTRS
jgi:hypothetical protein